MFYSEQNGESIVPNHLFDIASGYPENFHIEVL